MTESDSQAGGLRRLRAPPPTAVRAFGIFIAVSSFNKSAAAWPDPFWAIEVAPGVGYSESVMTSHAPIVCILVAVFLGSGQMAAPHPPGFDVQAECDETSLPADENRHPARNERLPRANPSAFRFVVSTVDAVAQEPAATPGSLLNDLYVAIRMTIWIDTGPSCNVSSGADGRRRIHRPYPPSDRPLLV